MAARLPTPGGDSGRWGDILNEYLSVEHNADGSLKVRDEGLPATIPDGSITAPKLSTSVNNSLDSAQTAVQSVNGETGTSITLTAADISGVMLASQLIESPLMHGAIGNGVADDTVAVQAAIDAALTNGRDLILNPPTTFRITSKLVIKPPSSTQCRIKMKGVGNTEQITWAGGNGTDSARVKVFEIQGLKRSRIEHVNIRFPASATYVIGWELDNIDGQYESLSQLTFEDCHVAGTSNHTGCGGWRVGHLAAGSVNDFSFINWVNCGSALVSAPAGSFHINIEGRNALNNNIFGGYAYFCNTAIGNRSTTGAAATSGNASIFTYGFGTSHCNIDYDFASNGTYVIDGGRYEVGKRFLNLDLGGSLTGADVIIKGVTLGSYEPSDGIVFYGEAGSAIFLEGLQVRPPDGSPDFGAAMITLNGNSGTRSFLSIKGGQYRCTDPMVTFMGASNWSVERIGMRYINSSQQVSSSFRNLLLQAADYSDVLALMVGAAGGGSVGGVANLGLQPGGIGSSNVPRTRLSYDGGTGAVLEASTREVTLRGNGTAQVTATADGRTRMSGGFRHKRTLPGAYPYTILITDNYVPVSTGAAGRSATLPSATTVGAGHEIIIKDYTGSAATNNFTINRAGADTIDGATSRVISTNYGSVRLVSDGATNWEVL